MDTEQDKTGAEVVAAPGDAHLLDALRRGDEGAFRTLVDRHALPMLCVAATYVSSRAVAEEVVQDTWLAVIGGLDRFEGRSSLKTWIFRILTNAAKTRAEREGRTVPFSEWPPAVLGEERAVGPERFLAAGQEGRAGHWATPLQRWPDDSPAARLFARETRERIGKAIGALPPTQRVVITLRDVEGWSSDEVCDALDLSEENQRLLLHRARARVRRSLEGYFRGSEESA